MLKWFDFVASMQFSCSFHQHMISTNKNNKAFEVFPKHLGAKLVVTRVYYFNYHNFFFFHEYFSCLIAIS